MRLAISWTTLLTPRQKDIPQHAVFTDLNYANLDLNLGEQLGIFSTGGID